MNRASDTAPPFTALFPQALGLLTLALLLGVLWNFFSISKINYTYDYYPHIDTQDQPLSDDNHIPVTSAKDWQGRGKISQAGLVNLISTYQPQDRTFTLIDARKAELFNKSHISGAKKFDRYQLALDLPKVLPCCLTSDLVIIYCQGGTCEDSHIAKKILSQSGISPDYTVILDGGIKQWINNGNEVVK